MSHRRLTGWQKVTALLPLALLSGAWTASLATTTAASASPDGEQSSRLPDGTTVPNQALKAPASMTQPASIAPGVPAGSEASVVASSSATGIPAAALAAYQRATQVINKADEGCNLTWQLVAAIGRVESDHGRYGGNVLGDDGRSRPGIYGIPLDGSNGTAEISDTDAGDLDDDPVHDRAVGPMQFIPETWRVVGVDGDGDGRRDPQDIDDAALAAAVYLCSGEEDLATYGGQKAAVYRYNHSEEYVDLVIAIMNAYLDGDYSSTPNRVSAAPVFATPEYDDVPESVGGPDRPGDGARDASPRGSRPAGGPGGGPSGGPGGGSSEGPGDGPGGGSGGGSGERGTSDDAPTSSDAPTPGDPTPAPGGPTPGGAPVEQGSPGGTVENTLSALDKAKKTCRTTFTAQQIELLGGLAACAEAVLDKGVDGVTATLGGSLEETVGGVTGGQRPSSSAASVAQ